MLFSWPPWNDRDVEVQLLYILSIITKIMLIKMYEIVVSGFVSRVFVPVLEETTLLFYGSAVLTMEVRANTWVVVTHTATATNVCFLSIISSFRCPIYRVVKAWHRKKWMFTLPNNNDSYFEHSNSPAVSFRITLRY